MGAEDLLRSPQLPLLAMLPVLLASGALLALALFQARGLVACFLLLAVWVRVVSGSLHQYTFVPVVGGLSINALLSVMTVLVGLALIPVKTFRMQWAFPIYAIITVVILSSIVNRTVPGMIDMSFKWAYVLVMIAALQRCMLQNGETRTLMMLMCCYAPLFGLQLASVALGMPKQAEADGSASYIGGYFHEATFSVMALTFATVAYLARGLGPVLRFGFIMIGVLSIILANYRTAIVAVLPMLLVFGLFATVSTFRPQQRRIIASFVIPAACFAIALLLTSDGVQQRFADLFSVLANPSAFIKPRVDFNEFEEKVLSGRVAIWTGYVEGYLNGTGLQFLVGLGPNSWYGVMAKYAHNTVISFLFELGPLGVAALLATWVTFFAMTMRVSDPAVRLQLMAAQIGFLLLNMATMPHWQIEGNIMFAAIQACVLNQLVREARGVGSQRIHQANSAARGRPLTVTIR